MPVFIRMSLCSLLLIFFHAPNLIQAECTKSDESPSVTVWNSSHLHISWENAFRKCKDGHVERAYVKGSLDFGMALVNFSHGSITRKISPCSSYPDIRKVIQKDFAWDIPRRVNVVLGGGLGKSLLIWNMFKVIDIKTWPEGGRGRANLKMKKKFGWPFKVVTAVHRRR